MLTLKKKFSATVFSDRDINTTKYKYKTSFLILYRKL